MDKDLLFKPRLPEDSVVLPGVGTIRVRGLNRVEALTVEKITDIAARERRIVSLGMVDPQMSEADVLTWAQAAPADELEQVALKIADLSGILPDSAKAMMKHFEADPEEAFRLHSGAAVAADGGGATGVAEQS